MIYKFVLFLFFNFILPSALAQKVFFSGRVGNFYHPIFKSDNTVSRFVSDSVNEAEIIIFLEPSISEAVEIMKEKRFKKKKLLFVFYYERPQFFDILPNLYLKVKSESLDRYDLNFVSNSPFNKPYPKIRPLVILQYNVWKEVFKHLSLAKAIEN
jgi:hypothetical protein